MPSPADDILAIYDEHAAAFARQRNHALFERGWLDAFLDAMPEGREVLDMGCGTGLPLAGYLASRGCRMTGLDGAAAMIAAARRNLPDHRWVQADMRQPPALGPFDGLLAWHSFFHLTPEAQRGMFPVFARLARPGAPLMFTSGPAHGEAVGCFEGRPLYHASLDPAEYRALLRASGFEVLRHVANDPSCDRSTIWLARKLLPSE